MATNLSIDPNLLDKALRVSGEKTKKAAVTKALEEFIARREQRGLIELFSKLDRVQVFPLDVFNKSNLYRISVCDDCRDGVPL